MRLSREWMVVLILAGLLLPACTQRSELPRESKPAKLERVEGTDLSRVTLSPKAAERLDIKTAQVRDEPLGSRKRTVGGEVVAKPSGGSDGTVWVRVALSPNDQRSVAQGQPVRVVPLAREGEAKPGSTAQPVAADAAKDPAALHYSVGADGGLAPGQKVRVELPLAGAGTRRVVPHGAVLYDAKGKTWVYTSPEPLVFVRHAINVDYFEGDRAVLSDGPAPGTTVVTVGAAELFGTELGRK